MTDEDLIADEDVVVTISGRGYITPQPVATYRRQHRGGKGIIGHVTREEDAVEHLLVANTHHWALFFTNRGRVFSSKVHQIPDASRQAKGIPIINLPGVQVEPREVPVAPIIQRTLRGLVPRPRDSPRIVARRRLRAIRRVRSSGIIAITETTSWPGSTLRQVRTTSSSRRHRAKIARFHESRSPGDEPAGRWRHRYPARHEGPTTVVGMSVVQPEADILVLTETGYGKRVPLTEFRADGTAACQGVRLISLGGPQEQAMSPLVRRSRRTEEEN